MCLMTNETLVSSITVADLAKVLTVLPEVVVSLAYLMVPNVKHFFSTRGATIWTMWIPVFENQHPLQVDQLLP